MPQCESQVITPHITLHRWRVTEHSAELMLRCEALGLPSEVDAKAESRRREVLAERLMVHAVFGDEARLMHDDDLAPHIHNIGRHISIAHTSKGDSTLLCLAESAKPVGIDIEPTERTAKVMKVRKWFVNDEEVQWLAPDMAVHHLVAWTAKEAVFKLVARRSLVGNYSNDICLEPFTPPETPAWTINHKARFKRRKVSLMTTSAEGFVTTVAWFGYLV